MEFVWKDHPYVEFASGNTLRTKCKIDDRRVLFSEIPIISTQIIQKKVCLPVIFLADDPDLISQLEAVTCCELCLLSFEEPWRSLDKVIEEVEITKNTLPFLKEFNNKFPQFTSIFKCPHCKEVYYCSPKCRDSAWNSWHKFLCSSYHKQQMKETNQENHETVSNYIRKLERFCKANNNHVPMQIAQLFAMELSYQLDNNIFKDDDNDQKQQGTFNILKDLNKDSSPLSLLKNMVSDVGGKHPSFCYLESLKRFEEACYDEGERKLKDKGHLMLFQIIKYIFQNIDEVKSIQQNVVTFDTYSYLYGVLSLNCTPVIPVSPYMRYWQFIKSLPQQEKDNALAVLVHILKYLPRDLTRVDSSKGSGLYFWESHLKHSCLPNVETVFNQENHTVEIMSLRPIEKGDELLISYVDPRLPFVERQLILHTQYLISCDCIRCQKERIPLNNITSEELFSRHYNSIIQKMSKGKLKQEPLPQNSLEEQHENDIRLLYTLFGNPSKTTSMDVMKQHIKQTLDEQVISLLKSLQPELNSNLNFSLQVRQSSIEGAGRGVFMKGSVPKGTTVCFFSGMILVPNEISARIQQEGSVIEQYFDNNKFLLTRRDKFTVDGNIDPGTVCFNVFMERHPFLKKVKEGSSTDNNPILEMNPFAVGSYINHPTSPSKLQNPNMLLFDYDFNLEHFPQELKDKIPFVYFDPSMSEDTTIRAAVGITIKDVANEELFCNYRYPITKILPDWYIPIID